MQQRSVSLADLEPLRKAYNQAVKAKKEQFTYKGTELLTSYAKYLLEYLQTFKNDTRNNN